MENANINIDKYGAAKIQFVPYTNLIISSEYTETKKNRGNTINVKFLKIESASRLNRVLSSFNFASIGNETLAIGPDKD